MLKYELAVIGAGIGGLAAAALACKINKRAVVLEPGDSAGGAVASVRINDFVFYPGPWLSFGFERGGSLQQLTETLGIAHKGSLRSPCYQVALPDRRVTVYAEQSETVDELAREFPKEIDKIRNFYRDLRKQAIRNSKSAFSAFLSRRSARTFINSYHFSREFIAFLDLQSFYFFRRPVSGLSQRFLITLCDSAPFTLEGGFKMLADQVEDVLLKNGGEIRYRFPLHQVHLEKNGLSTAEGTLEAREILMNIDQDSRESRVICLGLREQVIPVGMLSVVLCLRDYDKPESVFTLSISRKDDETSAPSGMRALTAEFHSVHVPVNELIEDVKMMVPFLDEYLLFVQEHTGSPRTLTIPKGFSTKTITSVGDKALLSRTFAKGVYLLRDGIATPADSIEAGQRFIKIIT